MINASFSSKFNPFKVGNVSAGALKDNTNDSLYHARSWTDIDGRLSL